MKSVTPKKKPPVKARKGDELFASVQAYQGFAFISDCMGDWPDDRVLKAAKSSLYHTNETARILRRFIKENK